MDRKTPDPVPGTPNAVERQRRPDGPLAPGESPGKRTNETRNDPDVEPGAGEGQPRPHANHL